MQRNNLVSIEVVFCPATNNIHKINITRADTDAEDFIRLDGSTVGEGDKKGPVPVFVKDLGNLAKDFVRKYLSLCEANAENQALTR